MSKAFKEEIMHIEKYPGIGQRCSECGIFYSFREDPLLRDTGICKKCREGEVCPTCQGREVVYMPAKINGSIQTREVMCPTCRGLGRIFKEEG